jgi:hypothetical protein
LKRCHSIRAASGVPTPTEAEAEQNKELRKIPTNETKIDIRHKSPHAEPVDTGTHSSQPGNALFFNHFIEKLLCLPEGMYTYVRFVHDVLNTSVAEY